MLIKKWTLAISIYLCVSLSLSGNVEQDQIIRSITQELTACQESDIEIKSLEGGLTNENYKVCAGSSLYFFRFNKGADSALGCSLEREWLITSAVSQFGICPKVLYYGNQERVLVTDFIRAKNEKINLRDPSTLQRLCRQISTLHHLKIEFPTQFDPYINLENYLDKALELGLSLPPEMHLTILPAIRSFQQAESYTLESLKTPAHLDLHAGNVMDDGKKIWLIDWEYAAMADPFFDLATLVSVENFSNSEMHAFLALYLERNPSSEEINHFYLMRILADTRWALWSFIQAKISPLDEPFEEEGHEYILRILERIK